MGFDIPLMGGFSFKAVFYDQIGLCETCFNIPVSAVVISHNIGMHASWNRFIRRPFANDWRTLCHSLVHISHMIEHLVGDIDQFQRVTRNQCRSRSYCCHGMPVIKRFFPGHDIFQNVPWLTRQSGTKVGVVRKIGACHNSFDAFQRFCFACVDGKNTCMGMRGTQNRPMKHARRGHIRTKFCTSRDFVYAIGALRSCPHKFKILGFCIV